MKALIRPLPVWVRLAVYFALGAVVGLLILYAGIFFAFLLVVVATLYLLARRIVSRRAGR